MTITNPPATTTPAAYKTWAQAVADEVNGLTTDIAGLEDGYTATGEQVAPDFKATGKTGATTSPGILAGGTNTGAAPTTGTHVVGELVIGHDGKLWACTTAGTPGTWTRVGSDALDADDVVDLFTGTPDGTQFLRDDGTLAVPAGGGGGSNGLVARHIYSTSSTKTATTTSLTDLDATNLAITFTVPASGNVAVKLYGASAVSANSELWGLREASSQVGNIQFMSNTSAITRKHAVVTVTGLTPAASKTYKWAAKVSATVATATLYIGGSGGIDGDAVMEVWEIP